MSGEVEVGVDNDAKKFRKLINQTKQNGFFLENMDNLIRAKLKASLNQETQQAYVFPVSYKSR